MKDCYGYPERIFWESLRRLKDPAFQPFIAYLTASLEESRIALEQASDPMVIHRLQGRVTQLREILGMVEQSAKIR